jgi:hypothetical protein
VKLIQEKTGNTLDHIGNNFMNRTPISQQLKESVDKWDCMKLKSFCTAKKAVIRLKRQPETAYRMGEDLCQFYIWQGINNQNTQGVQKTNVSKNQQPTE